MLQPDLGSYHYLAYLILFFGTFTIYIRFFLNISLFLTISTLCLQPSLLSPDILYILGEGDQQDPILPKGTTNNYGRPYFTLVDRSKNYYHQNFNPQLHSRLSRGSNFVIGFAGLFVGGATLYYAKMQTDHAAINSFEMTRQNDLEEVSQGLMSKEEYQSKYKCKS